MEEHSEIKNIKILLYDVEDRKTIMSMSLSDQHMVDQVESRCRIRVNPLAIIHKASISRPICHLVMILLNKPWSNLPVSMLTLQSPSEQPHQPTNNWRPYQFAS